LNAWSHKCDKRDTLFADELEAADKLLLPNHKTEAIDTIMEVYNTHNESRCVNSK
jgi:hypothetical protein